MLRCSCTAGQKSVRVCVCVDVSLSGALWCITHNCDNGRGKCNCAVANALKCDLADGPCRSGVASCQINGEQSVSAQMCEIIKIILSE